MLAGSASHSALRAASALQANSGPQRPYLLRSGKRCEARHRQQCVRVLAALGDPGPGSNRRRADSSGSGGGLDPALERAVPADQRPVNELKQLRQTTLYSWVRHAGASCTRSCLPLSSKRSITLSLKRHSTTLAYVRRRPLRRPHTSSGLASPGWLSFPLLAGPSPTRPSTLLLRWPSLVYLNIHNSAQVCTSELMQTDSFCSCRSPSSLWSAHPLARC